MLGNEFLAISPFIANHILEPFVAELGMIHDDYLGELVSASHLPEKAVDVTHSISVLLILRNEFTGLICSS